MIDLGLRAAARRQRDTPPPTPAGPTLTVLPPVHRGRRWPLATASALLHVVLLALVLRLSRAPRPEHPTTDPAAARRQVNMVYLPPLRARSPKPPAPRPAPAPEPMPPPAPVDRERETRPPSTTPAVPDPEPGQSAHATRAATDQPRPGAPTPESRTASAAGAKAAGTPTLESEAARLFGTHLADPQGAGPRDTFGSLAALGLHGGSAGVSDCRPVPHPPRAPGEPPRLASVRGRIYRRDNGRPLAFASLQMIGTPYIASSDATGWYVFNFDEDLVADCRTQLVRISAPGYRTEIASVLVAPDARESDVALAPGR